MVINGTALLALSPIKDMKSDKFITPGSVTAGLGEAGYDICIKQDVKFNPTKVNSLNGIMWKIMASVDGELKGERFCIASAIEEFQMPSNLMGIVHDKSSWARQGLSVFNTVIEPGWNGFLTLELVYHGSNDLYIPAGSGIAQVVFHQTIEDRAYTGRYQSQEDKPVPAIKARKECRDPIGCSRDGYCSC